MSKKKLLLMLAAAIGLAYLAKRPAAGAATSSVSDGSKPGELDPKTFLPR